MEESTYEKVYVGEETESLAIKDAFNQKGILFIERNNIESGLRGGFYGGASGVEILVQEKDVASAKKIIDSIFDS
jgi:hypothetical protein